MDCGVAVAALLPDVDLHAPTRPAKPRLDPTARHATPATSTQARPFRRLLQSLSPGSGHPPARRRRAAIAGIGSRRVHRQGRRRYQSRLAKTPASSPAAAAAPVPRQACHPRLCISFLHLSNGVLLGYRRSFQQQNFSGTVVAQNITAPNRYRSGCRNQFSLIFLTSALTAAGVPSYFVSMTRKFFAWVFLM